MAVKKPLPGQSDVENSQVPSPGMYILRSDDTNSQKQHLTGKYSHLPSMTAMKWRLHWRRPTFATGHQIETFVRSKCLWLTRHLKYLIRY